MKKELLIFFLLFVVLPLTASADLKSYCNDKIYQIEREDLDNLKIKNINVKIDDHRKWTKNSLNILIGNFRWIPKKFKKRFNSNVTVKFENGLLCTFKARVRNNGNQKDHIALKGNSIIQSIDVHLKTGSINGITKFKLLRPNTRGNFKDEILLTELLREFDYLAPRTNYIEAKINDVRSKMLFQEKPDVALLKFNQRKEGPIFEGDERFMFRLAENVPDNQTSNLKIGMLPLLEKGVNAMLARQINSEWIFKNKKHSDISYNSLSNLNLAYLLYNNKYRDGKNDFWYSNYILDNNLLALNNSKNVLKLDIYNLIVFSANGTHGLGSNNRKFYWNSSENFFEPINSDTNANIELETTFIPLPISEQIEVAFSDLEKLLDEINTNEFTQKVTFRGLNLTELQVKKKINKLKKNLYKLKTLYVEINPEIIAYNRNNKIEKKMWNKYYESLHEINPNIYIVKHLSESSFFKRCETKSLRCIDYNFSKNQIMDLVGGTLVIDGKEYQYVGKNADIDIN